jgi:3-oxoacyl-[acyl-carrier protein] reductase
MKMILHNGDDMTRYSKIKVGDSETVARKITIDDINLFVELSGDDNLLHIDKEFASRTSFKDPVVHGMIGASFISTVIGTKIPGDGALWYSQSLEFLLPVRIGDRLEITATVIKKIDRLNSIELTTEIHNQKKQLVTSGIAKVKIVEDEKLVNSNIDYPEKTALIIGSTGGIGMEVARTLLTEGFNLILHYHSNKTLAVELKKELEAKTDKKVIIVQANILIDSEVTDMIKTISRYFNNVSALINTSTVGFGNIKIENVEWSDLLAQLEINIKSNLCIVQNILPLMEELSYGKIVFLTSQYTEQVPQQNIHYVTAKSALNGFSKALAIDLATRGIRVNLVSPGMTDTKLVADVPEKVKLTTAAKTPLRRLAKPKDVAEAISYLVTEKSDFLTGETIRVNGGQVML